MNRTFNKAKVSPTVQNEKVKSERRDQLSQQFAHQRELDAQSLLEDMLVDNFHVAQQQKSLQTSPLSGRRKATPVSERASRKNRVGSNEFKREISPVPALNLKPTIDLPTAQMSLENRKPSLMAKTIMQMKRKEEAKQCEAENLLRSLEMKARSMVNNDSNEKSSAHSKKKIVKPFTELVKLQEPTKLRDHPEHKPLTYTQQLMKHQESTITLQTSQTNINQAFKVYGTKRLKGVYDTYVKESPRRVKTYSERLKELRPKESQALIKPSKQTSNIVNTKIRHNLQKKSKARPLNESLNKHRFRP